MSRRQLRPTPILAAALAALALPAAAAVDLSLNVIPTDLESPHAGGDWSLVVKTDDGNGMAALRATLLGADNGAVADGDTQDDISIPSGLGAIDPVPTSAGPRPPYLDLGGGVTELIYGQDISDGVSVVTGVGTSATGGGPDPLGEAAWDDATTIFSGTYPASVPGFAGLDANELDQSSPPFTASAATVTSVVRVLPEPGASPSFAAGAAALALLAVRRRRKRPLFALLGVAVFVSTLPTAALAQGTSDPIDGSAPLAHWSLVLEDVVVIPVSAGSAPRLEFLTANATTGLAYVIDQRGAIHAFDPSATTPTAILFLDLETAIGSLFTGNESGVRGLAFHPDFADDQAPGYRKMYVSFSRSSGTTAIGNPTEFDSPGNANHYTVLSEWELDASGAVVAGSYRELIRVKQPFANHNSGHIGFDPTKAPGSGDYGLLYFAVGDGGASGGPSNLSQDIDASPAPYPHGKILRIDPILSGGDPYTIPATNPFAGLADRVEEVWAFGLRNPHKFSWDPVTGAMYLSDIGQGVVEEISVGRIGANYGWNLREGTYVYENTSSVSALPAGHGSDAFTYPVAQYDHSDTNGINGSSAIVGGPVYRGVAVPELTGMYLFADFAMNPGPIFAVDIDDLIERDDFSTLGSLHDGRLSPYVEVEIRDGSVDKDHRQFLRDANADPGMARTDLRWGVDAAGEVYVLNKRDGHVRRIAGVVELDPGDANRDGSVDGQDLSRWTASYGLIGDWSDGNFNAGPVVDGDDFILWQRNSGSVP